MKINTIKMDIKGMTCDHCATSIAKILNADGIVEKNVSFRNGSAEVSYATDKISAKEITGMVNDTGQYQVTNFLKEDNVENGSPKHLIIIGGGSAAFAATIEAQEQGARVTMINDGLPIGGTCVNVGCVPSKNLIRAAETLHRSKNNPFPGIQTDGSINDFRAVINQKNSMVQDLRQEKYINIIKDMENFRLVKGRAKVISPTSITVNGEIIEGDKILIATGARPHIPEIEGLNDVPYLTNEEAFELDKLPESIIVMGGRYIALETAQMFARFGSNVTILQRSDRILPSEAADLTEALTEYLREEGLNIVTGNNFLRVYKQDGDIAVDSKVRGEFKTFMAEKLIVATGRTPNTAHMGLEEIGVQLKGNKSIIVDDILQTSVPGIYAAGDVLGENMFVYTAAYEGQLASRNALTGDQVKSDYTVLPWVIFTDPQVTGVGLDEDQAKARGINAETSTLSLDYVPRAIAARDTRGFIKLIRDVDTDKLIGARILAPEGAELIMEVSLAIKYGITVRELVDMFHPYLTMAEGIKLAAITFGKDVAQLSCCAI
ncbi:MAG: mercury(II) reductase [Candidatus Marinimicrobia bacterium]|nr:mercury(II) reductase [Candidatus Neomarinimicrobiota bacterium]